MGYIFGVGGQGGRVKSSPLAPTIDEKLWLFVNSVMAYETNACSVSINKSKDEIN